jgi:hypothetical protein
MGCKRQIDEEMSCPRGCKLKVTRFRLVGILMELIDRGIVDTHELGNNKIGGDLSMQSEGTVC